MAHARTWGKFVANAQCEQGFTVIHATHQQHALLSTSDEQSGGGREGCDLATNRASEGGGRLARGRSGSQ